MNGGGRAPRDLPDLIMLGGGVLLACAGVLHLAGGLSNLLSTREWVRSPWPDALKVVFEPGDPALAFGLASGAFHPVLYWLILLLLLSVPFAGAVIGHQLWSRHGPVRRTRTLASRPGLASAAEVEAAVGRRQILRRGQSARPAVRRPEPSDVGRYIGRSRGRQCWASVEDSTIVL